MRSRLIGRELNINWKCSIDPWLLCWLGLIRSVEKEERKNTQTPWNSDWPSYKSGVYTLFCSKNGSSCVCCLSLNTWKKITFNLPNKQNSDDLIYRFWLVKIVGYCFVSHVHWRVSPPAESWHGFTRVWQIMWEESAVQLYLAMLQSGSMRWTVGSSMYSKVRLSLIWARSTLTLICTGPTPDSEGAE